MIRLGVALTQARVATLIRITGELNGDPIPAFLFNGVYLEPGKYTVRGTLILMVVCPQFWL